MYAILTCRFQAIWRGSGGLSAYMAWGLLLVEGNKAPPHALSHRMSNDKAPRFSYTVSI